MVVVLVVWGYWQAVEFLLIPGYLPALLKNRTTGRRTLVQAPQWNGQDTHTHCPISGLRGAGMGLRLSVPQSVTLAMCRVKTFYWVDSHSTLTLLGTRKRVETQQKQFSSTTPWAILIWWRQKELQPQARLGPTTNSENRACHLTITVSGPLFLRGWESWGSREALPESPDSPEIPGAWPHWAKRTFCQRQWIWVPCSICTASPHTQTS